ncbi:hypothetical protein [Flavobacterium sp. ASV13]|uniref:hypothetical protein n=1 Tax=Flavobacterium sp. ASV13 TaxID=1506583 RepID=UPI000551C229|nr:hypothetical protein [Flavobacterium sp. ASV13]
MSKFIDEIFVGIATFVLTVFLPKRLIVFLRELIKFIFLAIIKYWYVSILLIGLVFLINDKTDCKYLDQFFSKTFLLITLISVLLIVPIIALLIQFFKNYKSFNVAYYGAFTVKENEYLTIDLDSENLNERFEKITALISRNHYSYKNNLITVNVVNVPKFIVILLGANRFNKFVQKRIASKKHLSTIHFIRDINKQNLTVVINFDDKGLSNTVVVENAENLIGSLCSDSSVNNLKIIDISAKIYFLLFGQILTDKMIDSKKFAEVHYLLDDTEKLLLEISHISTDLGDKNKNLIVDFINFWKSYIERYRAILLIEQDQFFGAIQHIMKSIELNPYFPYHDYQTLKQDYTKKYGISLIPSIRETVSELGLEDDENDNENIKNSLEQQVQFAETTFNYEIVKEILRRENTEKIRNSLINEFSKLDKNNPFILLTIAEVIKHIEKGTEKFNEIYIDRIDETINLLNDILKLDNDFPLIHTKIGLLSVFKGVHFDNEAIIEKGLEEYEKGVYYMSKLGFKY